MRLVIDPGLGEWIRGYVAPQSAARVAWVLQVARELARLCEARGAAVVATRTDETFVPSIVRNAYAREFGADIVLSLYAGPPVGQSLAAVRFGFRWWQPRPGRALAGCLLAALEAAFPLWPLAARGVRLSACAGIEAPLRTLPLLIVAHPPANPSASGEADPDVWARALAGGLFAYHLGGDGAAVHYQAVPLAAERVRPALEAPVAAESSAPAPSGEKAAESPRAVLLVPGMRHVLVGAPLLMPRGFTATPGAPLPAGSTTAKGH